MASSSLVDYYNSRANLEKLNPLIRSAYNTSSDFDAYKQKVLQKVETDHRSGHDSFFQSIEDIRREQRVRLAQVEHDYYNQQPVQSFDVPFYAQTVEHVPVTSKPPLPTASRRSPSPVFLTEETHQHVYHRLSPTYPVRRHDEQTAFCSHRTNLDETMSSAGYEPTTSHVQHHVENLWDEYELEDYLEKKKSRRPPSAPAKSSWAGRVTIPEPFALTSSTTMDNIHRRKCVHQAEAEKLQKEVEEELTVHRSFKAKPVPAHVHMPLYEQLQDEQRARREQVHHMTKEYLDSISKPFGFDSREKGKSISRRHSYSGDETPRREPHFRAKPLPDFYYRTTKDIEEMKENSLYRSIKKDIRAKELLRQSRLPFSMQQRKLHSKQKGRSRSTEDLTREYTFKPKTNGYYIPNYDKMHAKFLRETEQAKRTRSSTKCEPFLLYTNLIPSRREKVLDEMRDEDEQRYLETFQIKGKQLPTKSTSGMSLSASLQQTEAIPTKSTESQRLREAIGKKKRRDDEIRNRFEEKFQRSRSARERRLREKIQDRAKAKDQSAVYKAKRDANNRAIRHSMRRTEDEYAQKLDDINLRVDNRPLLLEQDQSNQAVRDLEREIQHAMQVAKISEKDLMRQKYNPPHVKVTALHRTDSA